MAKLALQAEGHELELLAAVEGEGEQEEDEEGEGTEWVGLFCWGGFMGKAACCTQR